MYSVVPSFLCMLFQARLSLPPNFFTASAPLVFTVLPDPRSRNTKSKMSSTKFAFPKLPYAYNVTNLNGRART